MLPFIGNRIPPLGAVRILFMQSRKGFRRIESFIRYDFNLFCAGVSVNVSGNISGL